MLRVAAMCICVLQLKISRTNRYLYIRCNSFFQVFPEESGVSSSLLSSANGGIGVSNVLPSDRSNRYLPLCKNWQQQHQWKNKTTHTQQHQPVASSWCGDDRKAGGWRLRSGKEKQIPFVADPTRRLLAFSMVPLDREPVTGDPHTAVKSSRGDSTQRFNLRGRAGAFKKEVHWSTENKFCLQFAALNRAVLVDILLTQSKLNRASGSAKQNYKEAVWIHSTVTQKKHPCHNLCDCLMDYINKSSLLFFSVSNVKRKKVEGEKWLHAQVRGSVVAGVAVLRNTN